MTTTPTPKPTPHPGPRPGATVQAAAHHRPASSPADFGRIAEDGTVYLTTAEGERVIGVWQAGTPEQGLSHYGQRYDDLATEVDLLAARLRSHPEENARVRESATELKASLATAAVLGDIPALDTELDRIIADSLTTGEKVKAQKAERREKAIAAKEKLAAEAEDIAANSTNWKEAGDRLRAILEEWKKIRGIDRKTDDQLWKRYSKARDSFNRRRGSHFAELDRSRAAARRTKEALVERAEALKDSTAWGETARAFRDLMQEWKAAGRAPREVDDRLWEQFRAAQDHFFDARNAVNKAHDEEMAANAAAKQALLDEYTPQINPADDLPAARTKLRELQEKWEEIGFVPRHQIRELEGKIEAIERSVNEAAETQWRRTDPAAQARAAQFTAKVEEFTKAAEQAAAAGKSSKADKLRAQAKQWQEWADAALNAVENR